MVSPPPELVSACDMDRKHHLHATLPSHPRLLLQLLNLLTCVRLPHTLRHTLSYFLRHHGHIPHLLPSRLIIARRPRIRVLDRLSRSCISILRRLIFELFDFGRGFGFVHLVGIDLVGNALGGGEGGDEGFLFGGWGVGAGGPLGRVVELVGHLASYELRAGFKKMGIAANGMRMV